MPIALRHRAFQEEQCVPCIPQAWNEMKKVLCTTLERRNVHVRSFRASAKEDAVPLFDHPVIGEFNVSWNAYLGVWIMTYNIDTDSALLKKLIFIQFWTSLTPWGPWSEPQILFNPENGPDDQQCNIIYHNFNEGWKASCIQKTDFA